MRAHAPHRTVFGLLLADAIMVVSPKSAAAKTILDAR